MSRIIPRALLIAAAPLLVTGVLGAGAVALAQTADPGPQAPGAEADARPLPAQFRDGDRGGRHGHGQGRRGGLLGAFGPAGAADLFEAADGDGDGALTQAELDAFLAAQVSGADADGDGALALEEFAPLYFERMRPVMVDAFQALDEDGSGELAQAELDDRFGGVVARLDRDGDDALTLQDGRRDRDDD